MAELTFDNLSGKTYVARGPSNVGMYDGGGGGAVLIDSGNDDDAGKRLVRACASLGLVPTLVANTHSHADHCGGNAYLQAKTSCGIAAPRTEAAFVECPLLEPSFVWGGYPLAPLRSKFMMAKPSRVTELLDPPCALGDTGIRVLPLPGHSYAMAGYRTPDSVFFVADALASPVILDKYPIFVLYDVEAELSTLDELARIDADWFVPSHAPPTQDIRPLAAYNREKILAVADFVLESCAVPISPEELLARLPDRFGIELNHTQYALMGSTLRSYLAWLVGRKEIASSVERGRLLFERA